MLYLKGLFEGYAIGADDSDFEWQHFKDVTYHAQILAYDRHLDEEIALIIASGHDIGRTYGKLYGKGHGKASAKILKKVLYDNGFVDLYSKKDINRVLRAIENHSKKQLIEDDYSELIKDADTLAHVDENLLVESNDSEYIRYRALMSKCSINCVAPLHKWIGTFEKLSGSLLHLWECGFHEGNEIEWVHQVRTTTRKLRSILMVFRALEQYFVDATFVQKIDAYEKNLVKVLKLFENARGLAVMLALEAHRYHHKDLKRIYQNELNRLEKLMNREDDRDCLHENLSVDSSAIFLDNTLATPPEIELHSTLTFECTDYEGWQKNCESTINRQLKKYILAAAEVNGKSIKKIHKVRIQGKQIKYLFELGLIENTNEHLSKMVTVFHEISGEIHDITDALAFKHAKRYFDVKQLKHKQATDLENLKKYVFYFEKVSKQIKSS